MNKTEPDSYLTSKTYLSGRKSLIAEKKVCAYCGMEPIGGFKAKDRQFVYCNMFCLKEINRSRIQGKVQEIEP